MKLNPSLVMLHISAEHPNMGIAATQPSLEQILVVVSAKLGGILDSRGHRRGNGGLHAFRVLAYLWSGEI